MKGWHTIILTLLSCGLAGCTQRLISECGWRQVYEREHVPPSLEYDAAEAVVAPLLPSVTTPATVTDPDRQPWYLSLQEAFAIALENGNVGSQAINAPGLVGDDLGVFAGQGVTQPDSIRVLSLDPARSAAGIEAALARFDVVWATSMAWNTVDQPTQGLSSFSNGMGANFSSSLAKPLPTGGVAGITYGTGYQLLANPPTGNFSVVNPAYTTSVQIGIEQPLLRGFGVDVNEVLANFPGSTLFPAINSRRAAGTPEGILISRIRFDQQRAEFQRNVNFQILNVEAAYWNLYGGYMTMYAAEQGLRQAHAAWIISKQKYTTGAIDLAQYALVRAQYEQFRAARMKAMGDILNFERALRTLLGVPVEDGKRLIPADAPSMTPYVPNWEAAVRDCTTLRPELVMAREELQAKEMRLKAIRNGLLPDLRFQASYTALGLGTRLDGNGTFLRADGSPVTNNAIRSLLNDGFNNWTMGLNLNVPLGFRYEYAVTRVARLELVQSYLALKEVERRSQSTLAKQYSHIIQNYKLLEIRRLAREALTEQLQVRFKQYVAGAKGSTLEFLLDAQRQWATALNDEFQSVVDYNVSLATFELARGTILERNKVVIAEGPVPWCAEVRAVEHEKERTRAFVLREAAKPVIYPPLEPEQPDLALLPELPRHQAPTLPSLLHEAPRVPAQLDEPAPIAPATFGRPSGTTRPPEPRAQPSTPEQLPPLTAAEFTVAAPVIHGPLVSVPIIPAPEPPVAPGRPRVVDFYRAPVLTLPAGSGRREPTPDTARPAPPAVPVVREVEGREIPQPLLKGARLGFPQR